MRKLLCVLVASVLLLSAAPAALAGQAEPVVVTMAVTAQLPTYINESNEFKLLLEREGIDLQTVYCDTEKLGIMLSSGDLPDIVCSVYAYLPTILSNNMAMNLDPILEEYLPNLASDVYKTCNDLLRTQMSGGTGNLYFVVPGQGVEYAGSEDRNIRGYTVRWDLYKELGLPEIKDDRDYADVIAQMLALAGGQTKGGQTVYGFGMAGTTLGAWYSRGRYVAEAATRATFSGYLYEASITDGTLINGYTNLERSPFWVDIRFYNDLWNRGLMDPDCFTMTASELSEKTKAGQYVAARSRDHAYYNVNVLEDPETLEGYVMIPSEGGVIHADFLTPCGFAPTNYTFISAASKNWENAAKVVNFLYDPDIARMIYSGVQGVHWDYDENGVPTMFDETLKLISELGFGSEALFKETGIWGGHSVFNPWVRTGTHPDGYFYDLRQEQVNRAKALSYLDRDYANTFGFDTPSAYHVSLIDSGKALSLVGERGLLVTMGITDIPMDIQRIMGNCNDILFQYVAELVMAETQEEYDALVEACLNDLNAAGEADAWAWCSEAYDESFARINPIFEEMQAEYLANPAGR